MFSKRAIAILGLLIGIVLVSGCTQQYEPAPAPTEQVQPREVKEQSREVKEFTISAFSFGFEPSTISVNEGDTVKITITNQDIAHTFTIDELGVNEQLSAGQTKIIEFVANKKGTFSYYCAVSGHRPAGMEGQIIVS